MITEWLISCRALGLLCLWGLLLAGSLVALCGVFIALCWLVDVTLTRVLRVTRTMKLFLRFTWLDSAQRKALRDDLERLQKKQFEPDTDE